MTTAKAKKPKGAKKAPAKKAAPKKEPSPLVVAARGWFFRPTPLIITAFAISIAVMVPYVPYLLPDLTQLEEYQFEMEQIEVNKPTDWVPGDLIDNVLVKSSLPKKVSLLQSGICYDVANAFADHPWVKEAKHVSLTSKPAIRAHLEYRQPVAFVETKEGLFPIDVDGVLLPAADFAMEDVEKLPHILEVASMPRGNVGEPWQDPVVESAAKIAAALTPDGNMEKYWTRFELVGIVAPTVAEVLPSADDLRFELATVGGSRIIWGKPPGVDDLEPSVEQKIGRMEQYLSRFGKFDEPNGPYRIDIRLFDAISLEPLNLVRYQ
ncbi:hypothetical protein OAF74_00745 [bacterium]|jgi:hypothetical protein|nr:hypothetical protein [bacterium]